MSGPRTCDQCKFCLQDDFGYSNYTVEGTAVYCLKNLHPESGFDRFYGDDKRLRFAGQCAGFARGEPVLIDCERENLPSNGSALLSSAYTDDPEIKPLLDAWEAQTR